MYLTFAQAFQGTLFEGDAWGQVRGALGCRAHAIGAIPGAIPGGIFRGLPGHFQIGYRLRS